MTTKVFLMYLFTQSTEDLLYELYVWLKVKFQDTYLLEYF